MFLDFGRKFLTNSVNGWFSFFCPDSMNRWVILATCGALSMALMAGGDTTATIEWHRGAGRFVLVTVSESPLEKHVERARNQSPGPFV